MFIDFNLVFTHGMLYGIAIQANDLGQTLKTLKKNMQSDDFGFFFSFKNPNSRHINEPSMYYAYIVCV